MHGEVLQDLKLYSDFEACSTHYTFCIPWGCKLPRDNEVCFVTPEDCHSLIFASCLHRMQSSVNTKTKTAISGLCLAMKAIPGLCLVTKACG